MVLSRLRINFSDMAESSNTIPGPHSSGEMSEKQKGKQKATISSVSQVQLDESRLDHVSTPNCLQLRAHCLIIECRRLHCSFRSTYIPDPMPNSPQRSTRRFLE